jgi:hypothetical protein
MKTFKWITVVVIMFLSITSMSHAGPISVDKESAPSSDQMDKNLESISKLLVLEETDARHYSSNLQNLVGNYYQVITNDSGPVLQLLGRASEDMKVDKFELKDKILFKKITDKNYNAGVNIPWLNLKAEGETKKETIIQDIATVSIPIAADFIQQHLPSDNIIDATLPVYFISGATVTIISQKQYSTTNIEGSIPIINIGGKHLYSKDIHANSWIVSVTKILAKKPTSQEKSTAKLYEEDSGLNGLVVKVQNLSESH